MFSKRIGIDLGTSNILVYVEDKGVVINEPSVVAVSTEDNRVMAVGQEAKDMVGRTPEQIVAHRPLADGVIADYRVTEAMLRYFINKAVGSVRFFRPDVMVCVPAGVTSTERRAVIDAATASGAKNAYIIREPLAAAIGADIPIGSPSGNMVIDIGGGTSEVAVISLGGIVAVESARVGGDKFDQAIAAFIRRRHNLAIGDVTAEQIKIQIGSAMALPEGEEMSMEVRGRDMVAEMPKTINLKTNEVVQAIQSQLAEVINSVKGVLRQTPPELSADVIDRGMVMAGGGSLLRNIDRVITHATSVPCHVAEDPLFCVVRGTGVAVENLDSYKRAVAVR
ncbi:MAG: rod shape-determining protein [bacterium]|nr:rod shape-determining protein [bacterium]MDZ4248366.1 rod shape-determining protein [Patescibacteria group bacterium]